MSVTDRTWDLSILYNGFDDPAFKNDINTLDTLIAEVNNFAANMGTMSDTEVIRAYLDGGVKMNEIVEKLFIYANLRYSANTGDTDAASIQGQLMAKLSVTAAADTLIQSRIAQADIDAVIAEEPALEEFRYLLTNIKKDSRYLLSDKEETLFAKMSISGASAWSDLQSSLTSSLAVDYNGDRITLPAVRNLAYDPDPAVRKAAYEAELAACEKIDESVAFALNSIKLQVLNECELRGYESPLAKSLYTSRMKRETLDALLSAMEEYMPVFHKYLRAKAKLLGHEGGLPWHDLFAPVGSADKKYTVEDAKEYLLNIFGKFDTELHDMVKAAFDEAWIDFYPREGKVGGAFDCGVPSAHQSRVLTNFDGSFSDIVTLAHELGHSFHDRQVFCHNILNQGYSMPVAETASTFNEVLVMETAIAEADDRNTKLALMESQLQDACQIICDIYSRYTFEASVFEARPAEFMNADRMCELMLDAQKKAYGDGLSTLHRYMWLVKGHYYSGGLSFYNFPYAFGGLFARGLYAKYKETGADFVPVYKAMLRATSVTDVEECAKIAGIDLTEKSFWEAGLQSFAERVEEFCALANE
ncbi:MAG: M3 family oligoendopeptidase [Clostridia bacterium]|nr:M3 family oligoendopeptidase [Clostridia bacterium]MBQ8511052.1 M3 family oligoendopeptidase [Clostridia bacterium]